MAEPTAPGVGIDLTEYSDGRIGASAPVSGVQVPTPVAAADGRYYFNFPYEWVNVSTGVTWQGGGTYVQNSDLREFVTNRPVPSNDISTLGLDLTDIDIFRSENWVFRSANPQGLDVFIPELPAGFYSAVYYASDAVLLVPGQRVVTLDWNNGQSVETDVDISVGNNDAIARSASGLEVTDSGGGTGSFRLQVIGQADNPLIVGLILIPEVAPSLDSLSVFFTPYTSSGSGREWKSGEPSLQGTFKRLTVDPAKVPSNDLTSIGLVADEVQLFREANYSDNQFLQYLVPGTVDPGQYLAKFYFAEVEHTAPGQRVIEYVSINGVRFLQNVDLYAYAVAQGGAGNDANVFEVDFSVGPSGQVEIEVSASTGKPLLLAFSWEPRSNEQATYLLRNCGVNATNDVFEFTDSNGLVWTIDKDWVNVNQSPYWHVTNTVPDNLEEFGFTAADALFFHSSRGGARAVVEDSVEYRVLDYTVTLEGGFRYQVGFLTFEAFVGGERAIDIQWNGQTIAPTIQPPEYNQIALGFGFLDLKGVSGPQTGTLRFRSLYQGGTNNAQICGFYAVDESLNPPGRPTVIQFNLGGDTPRDFQTVGGGYWNEDTPFLGETMDETERKTLPDTILGLGDVGLQPGSDQGLIQDVRYAIDGVMTHNVQLETGSQWCLKVFMVEDPLSGNTVGGRVMDVYANNIQIASALDPLALASGQYATVSMFQCAPIDLRGLPPGFFDIVIEARQAAGANGAQPYPMMAAYELVQLQLSKVREVIWDSAGNPRTNQTGLRGFVWEVTQEEPPILGQLVASTITGTTDAEGFFELNLPASVFPGTLVVLGVSSGSTPEQIDQWSFFGPVYARRQ